VRREVRDWIGAESAGPRVRRVSFANANADAALLVANKFHSGDSDMFTMSLIAQMFSFADLTLTIERDWGLLLTLVFVQQMGLF